MDDAYNKLKKNLRTACIIYFFVIRYFIKKIW